MSHDHSLLVSRLTLALRDKPRSSLVELSLQLQVSPRTIQNAVSAVIGKKVRDLRDEALIGRVKTLLKSTPITAIKELAFEAGYKSPSAFARAVRRASGISPEELCAHIANELRAQKARA